MCMEDYIERLDDAVEMGELTEEEAREELLWAQITGEY